MHQKKIWQVIFFFDSSSGCINTENLAVLPWLERKRGMEREGRDRTSGRRTTFGLSLFFFGGSFVQKAYPRHSEKMTPHTKPYTNVMRGTYRPDTRNTTDTTVNIITLRKLKPEESAVLRRLSLRRLVGLTEGWL